MRARGAQLSHALAVSRGGDVELEVGPDLGRGVDHVHHFLLLGALRARLVQDKWIPRTNEQMDSKDKWPNGFPGQLDKINGFQTDKWIPRTNGQMDSQDNWTKLMDSKRTNGFPGQTDKWIPRGRARARTHVTEGEQLKPRPDADRPAFGARVPAPAHTPAVV